MCGTVCLSTTENILNDDGDCVHSGDAMVAFAVWFFFYCRADKRERTRSENERTQMVPPPHHQTVVVLLLRDANRELDFFLWSLEGHGHINLPYIYTSSYILQYICMYVLHVCNTTHTHLYAFMYISICFYFEGFYCGDVCAVCAAQLTFIICLIMLLCMCVFPMSWIAGLVGVFFSMMVVTFALFEYMCNKIFIHTRTLHKCSNMLLEQCSHSLKL